MKREVKVAAIVPMRHHSERVPGKNYRVLAGKPLYHHIVETLLSCPLIAEVWIDTDSDLILREAGRLFPIHTIRRPEHLRADTEPMNNILLHDVQQIQSDFYLQTHSTNPLLRSETISRAVAQFLEPGEHDSLFSVTRWQKRLYDAGGRPINHNPRELLRTQDLPPVFEENSCIYLFSRPTLETYGTRIGARPLRFEIAASEAVDIDDEEDFLLAECLYQRRLSGETREA